jgi:hypothetical protein
MMKKTAERMAEGVSASPPNLTGRLEEDNVLP